MADIGSNLVEKRTHPSRVGEGELTQVGLQAPERRLGGTVKSPLHSLRQPAQFTTGVPGRQANWWSGARREE